MTPNQRTAIQAKAVQNERTKRDEAMNTLIRFKGIFGAYAYLIDRATVPVEELHSDLTQFGSRIDQIIDAFKTIN